MTAELLPQAQHEIVCALVRNEGIVIGLEVMLEEVGATYPVVAEGLFALTNHKLVTVDIEDTFTATLTEDGWDYANTFPD